MEDLNLQSRIQLQRAICKHLFKEFWGCSLCLVAIRILVFSSSSVFVMVGLAFEGLAFETSIDIRKNKDEVRSRF
jgi:hypothetical protein